jgi:hypothetical protein
MKTLASLTKERNLVAIVLNSVIQNRPSEVSLARPQDPSEITNTPGLRAPQDALDPVSHPSIFGSNDFKPALGRPFGHCVDFHILLGKLPKRPHDTRLLNSEALGTITRPEMVNIAEVILDRWGNRIGLWSGFYIHNGVELKSVDS